jgi:hypothetical protein
MAERPSNQLSHSFLFPSKLKIQLWTTIGAMGWDGLFGFNFFVAFEPILVFE